MATKSFVANVAKQRLAFFLLSTCALIVVGCYSMTVSVHAESMIQAIICRNPATLSIEQPVSDSVVVGPSVTVSGLVSQANQIEVKIDGQFNSIVPLDASATSFTTSLQLAPGTHTITLTAVDVCQIGNAVSSVVITYQAPSDSVSGSVGDNLPTNVPGGGGVVVGRGGDLPQVTGAPTFTDRLVAPLVQIGRSLDLLPENATHPLTSRTPPWLRMLFLMLGFIFIMFSDQLTRLFGGTTSVFGVYSRRVRRSLFLLIGCGLIALAFLLG